MGVPSMSAVPRRHQAHGLLSTWWGSVPVTDLEHGSLPESGHPEDCSLQVDKSTGVPKRWQKTPTLTFLIHVCIQDSLADHSAWPGTSGFKAESWGKWDKLSIITHEHQRSRQRIQANRSKTTLPREGANTG